MKRTQLDERLLKMREAAKPTRDPTAPDDTLDYLLTYLERCNPQKILEIGTAEGLTTCAMLAASEATVTTIELDAERANRARENFAGFGVQDRVRLLEGDASEILPLLSGEYDMIFLDGPKVQYRRYFPDCKRLLKAGGALLADDVLLFGWVSGETPTPPKRRMLVEHIREYLQLVKDDPEFETEILKIGEGLAVSVKQK